MEYYAPKKNKEIGKKSKMLYEIHKRCMIIGLQGFDNYENLNPIEVSLDSNSLINELFKYKKYKYQFIIKNLSFSSSIMFLSFDGLKDAKEAFRNSKLYKTLGVIYLNGIENWDLIKRHSKRANVIFSDSENQDTKTKHFAFGFNSKNVSNLLKFYITLIDDKGEPIEFEKNENKVSVINFEIQVIR